MEALLKKRQAFFRTSQTQNPLPKIARHACSASAGFGRPGLPPIGWGSDAGWKIESGGSILRGREASPPSPGLGLGLELGRGSAHDCRLIGCIPRVPAGFTHPQLQELEQQALIYKYMEAGLPVPCHLVYPIWKSLACSASASSSGLAGPCGCGIHHQCYPTYLGGSPYFLDYKSGVDPEPGRCRRTDGKKWRCSKEVVPDKKYCERHMNRGRHRSRKHVETSQISDNSNTGTPPTDPDDLKSSINLTISLPSSSTVDPP
ncbi:growth-regulating factor 10-like [Malania oleifera]|uniref:growth-regulating factor 10-like n=1 Tax=Malania oleifera TaxID=397392 RepID=UPI0025AE383B|nr:growth-regulating factor 10-like [Malania oleifera]